MVHVIEGSAVSCIGGLKLYRVEYHPDSPPKAALCFHHGIAEHCGRYTKVFTEWANSGIAVYSGDMMGHGRSEGERCLIRSFDDVVTDFVSLCDHAAEDQKRRSKGSTPSMFIGGHSLGGLIAPLACLRTQCMLRGMLLGSPGLGQLAGHSLLETVFFRAKTLFVSCVSTASPTLRVVPAVSATTVNKDQEKVREYIIDPLNQAGIPLPACTAQQVLASMAEVQRRRAEFTLPVYCHHGTADKAVPIGPTREFIAGISSSDKLLFEVPGGFHEVLFESTGPELAQRMTEWVVAHTDKPAGAA